MRRGRFLKVAIQFILSLLCCQDLPAAEDALPGALDRSFQLDTVVTGIVRGIALQDDNRILIGGNFTLANDPVATNVLVARLMPDGSLDSSFAPWTGGPVGAVRSLVIQSDGKALVATDYSLERLNLDGSTDNSFPYLSVGFDDVWTSDVIATQESGKILVVGGRLQRFNVDGTLDQSFASPSEFNWINAVKVLSDQRIIVSGLLGTPQSPFGVIYAYRLKRDGLVDLPLGQGGFCLEVQPDGAVLSAEYSMYRLQPDGKMDEAFLVPITQLQEIRTIRVQPDGKILMGGKFFQVNEYSRVLLARLESDGHVDLGFDTSSGFDYKVGSGVFTLAQDKEGRILVGGALPTFKGQSVGPIVRFNGGLSPKAAPRFVQWPASQKKPAGAKISLDTLAVGYPNPAYQWFRDDLPLRGATNRIFTLENILPIDSGVYTVKASNMVSSVSAQAEVECGIFSQAGSLDVPFRPCSSGDCGSDELIGVLQNGRIVILRGPGINHLELLHPDGTFERTLAEPGSPFVYERVLAAYLLEQSDKRFVLVERYGTGTDVRTHIHRFTPDGDADATFQPLDLPLRITAAAAAPGDKIYIAGTISSGTFQSNTNGVWRVGSSGELDPDFFAGAPGPSPTFFACAVQNNGRILLGGIALDESERTGLIRFFPDGTIDRSFRPKVSNVRSIRTKLNGKINVAGTLESPEMNAPLLVFQLTDSGEFDPEFHLPIFSPGANVNEIAIQSDGKIIIAGFFASVDGFVRGQVARLNGDGTVDKHFLPNGEIDSAVSRIAIQNDNKVLLAGGWSWNVNDVPRLGIARLNLNAVTPPVEFAAPRLEQITLVDSNIHFSMKTVSSWLYSLESATLSPSLAWSKVREFEGNGYLQSVSHPLTIAGYGELFRVTARQATFSD